MHCYDRMENFFKQHIAGVTISEGNCDVILNSSAWHGGCYRGNRNWDVLTVRVSHDLYGEHGFRHLVLLLP